MRKNKRCENCQELKPLEKFCKKCNGILKADFDAEFDEEDKKIVKYYDSCSWCCFEQGLICTHGVD